MSILANTADVACLKECQAKHQVYGVRREEVSRLKMGKEYIKAVYSHPVYLTYMQSTSCEMPGWMKHKLKSRLLGERAKTSDMQMIPL